MSDRNSVVFFLQSHNEVDQISPIIWKIGVRNNIHAEVVLSSEISLQDYRIKEINNYENISIYGGHDNSKKEQVFRAQLIESVKHIGRKIPTEIPEQVYKNYIGKKELAIPNELDEKEYAAIGFDWSLSKHYKTDYLSSQDNITTLVLPHGDSPFRNHIIKESKFQELVQNNDNFTRKSDLYDVGFQDWKQMLLFDYLLFPNAQTANRVGDEDRNEQIKVLGSPRYNQEWLDVLSEIRPATNIDKTTNLAVVLFVRRKRYFVSKEEVKNTIYLLEQFPGVQTIVKEHPRDRLLDSSMADDLETVRIVKDKIQSTSLIEWGDIFLSLGTTITFEPVIRRKPVLALEYAHANQSIVSQYFPAADMRCKDDLYDMIHNILQVGTSNFYNDERYQQFVREMVTNSNSSVLNSWAGFIENIVLES